MTVDRTAGHRREYEVGLGTKRLRLLRLQLREKGVVRRSSMGTSRTDARLFVFTRLGSSPRRSGASCFRTWSTRSTRSTSAHVRPAASLTRSPENASVAAIELLLREGLGRPPQAEEAATPRLPRTAVAVENLGWADMQLIFAAQFASEITAVVEGSGAVLVRQRVAAPDDHGGNCYARRCMRLPRRVLRTQRREDAEVPLSSQ
jgi:hypothetical protein